MKAKTKVVLLSSALALGTAGVFGASTFAWFTRNTQAQMSISTATIKSSASNLSVTLIPISNKIDNAMEPIPVSGTEGNSYSADFTMLDYSSAFGDEFVSLKKNGSYDYVEASMAATKTAVFGISVETMAVRSTQTIMMSLGWDALSEDATTKANVNKYIRGGVVECTDSSFAIPADNPQLKKHAWIGANEDGLKNYVKYNESTDDFDENLVLQTSEYSLKGSQTQVGSYSAATTKYYRVCFWFEGTTDLTGAHDAVREETVGFTVAIDGSTM